MLRQVARGLPFVRELRGILINLDGRMAALERTNLDDRVAALERQSPHGQSHAYMEQALAAVSEFWRSYDLRIEPDRPPILVDLFHCNTEYLWRNLVIAKLVQHVAAAPLVGLFGEPGIVGFALGGQLSRADNVRLASAFGVNRFIDVPNEDALDTTERPARSAIAELAASQPDGTPLAPTAISKLREVRTESGFPLGRTIQETFMRAELEPTVLAGHRLVHWSNRALGFVDFAERMIASMRPSVFVTGHIDYCPWGTLAELLVRRGGRVVWYRGDCRLPIHILDRVDANSTLNGMIRRIEHDTFSEFERRIDGNCDVAERIDALAQARSAAVRRGVGRHCRWVSVNPSAGAAVAPAPFPNNNLPVYCLFAHTFTDQPAADEGLFVDYLEWVEETCHHAAAKRAYNLMVKIHPLDQHYDRSGAADRLAAEFASAPNIHFTRDHIEPEQLAKHCALGLTVRGTPGLEMTELGLPMMVAGRGLYSDTGICLAPRTRAEYFDLLARGPPFPIDIARQSRRGRRYMAFDRHWSAPMTPLVPSFNGRSSVDPNLWVLIINGIRTACLETDQVARALASAWSKGSTKVVSPEIDELLTSASQCSQVL
jgi:hypothetical protein